MIGLILRVFMGGVMPGAGFFAMLAGSFVACCTICGIYKCSKLRLRDCSCIKRCMRASGADKFDDFEVMILVHDAQFTTTKSKIHTAVKVTAGVHTVQTDESSKAIFQQPLAVFVEQGTEHVTVELLDSREKKVLAVLKLEPVKDILASKCNSVEKVYNMKQKNKGVLNTKIRLTMHLDLGNDAEKALLSNVTISTEADLLLRQQLLKDGDSAALAAGTVSELDILAKGCRGPLDMFGSWGSRESVFVAVRGPPEHRKYMMDVYKDEHEFHREQKPQFEVDLLKVVSVQPDPGRSDVFIINWVQSEKVTKRLTFRRLDRARDVWVEMLQAMIRLIRDTKDKRKNTKGGQDH